MSLHSWKGKKGTGRGVQNPRRKEREKSKRAREKKGSTIWNGYQCNADNGGKKGNEVTSTSNKDNIPIERVPG